MMHSLDARGVSDHPTLTRPHVDLRGFQYQRFPFRILALQLLLQSLIVDDELPGARLPRDDMFAHGAGALHALRRCRTGRIRDRRFRRGGRQRSDWMRGTRGQGTEIKRGMSISIMRL